MTLNRRIARGIFLALAVLFLGCLASALSGCYDGPSQTQPLGQHEVRIQSSFADRLVLYYVVGNTRMGTMARVRPYGRIRTTIPPSLRGSDRLRVLVCVGRWTPHARCTYAEGRIRRGPDGTIVTIFASTNLAAMVNE